MIQPFEITQEQLKDIDFICPSGKDYNLHLSKYQHYELSKSGKTLILIQEDEKGNFVGGKNFVVSKTVFVLKTEEVKQAEKDFKELQQYLDNSIRVLKDQNKLNLKELCAFMRGHNFDPTEPVFDINFKTICATIKEDKDGIRLLTGGVEVWDNDGNLIDTREMI